MATYSRILAWRIPWTEEPGGLPCPRRRLKGSPLFRPEGRKNARRVLPTGASLQGGVHNFNEVQGSPGCDGVSREVPCSALKGETVPDSLPATPKSPPTRRVPPRALAPHERLPEILVVPREKTPTGAAARGNP